MNNRIKQIMDYKQISPSELADAIGVQRSNVTHVLQGRNKPGFQFISKLLETFPELNAKWLITGQGDMLVSFDGRPTGLFDSPETEKNELPVSQAPSNEEKEPEKEPEIINTKKTVSESVNSLIPPTTKEIERIVVFYSDQTFKQYLPSN